MLVGGWSVLRILGELLYVQVVRVAREVRHERSAKPTDSEADGAGQQEAAWQSQTWEERRSSGSFATCTCRVGTVTMTTESVRICVHCINTNQLYAKFNHNSNPTTKQRVVVSIWLNIVAFSTYPGSVFAPFFTTSRIYLHQLLMYSSWRRRCFGVVCWFVSLSACVFCKRKLSNRCIVFCIFFEKVIIWKGLECFWKRVLISRCYCSFFMLMRTCNIL